MPTYEYECKSCGLRFERQQAITEEPVGECPECRGKADRLISGGTGFILKGSGSDRAGAGGSPCSWEETGRTCCGRDARCDKTPCGSDM
ncbi:MAG: zinc ribbon domain-containing protein [Deltaproteobacteria bacterium]|nr:zinc ribbon domain-containing protein [Deltaproteobacteria bacterium]